MFIEWIVGLAVVAIGLYALWKYLETPVHIEKKIKNGKTLLTVKTNKSLRYIVVTDRAEDEKITFLRNNVEPGTMEFIYPASDGIATVTIEDQTHRKKFNVHLES